MSKVSYFVAVLLVTTSLCSCAADVIQNENHNSVVFSNIYSDYSLQDINHYGCNKIDATVLEHILRKGNLVTDRDIHDYYSTTGCRIRGELDFNGKRTEFTYDYGGIIRFSNGKSLGCGEGCCNDTYEYCSYDIEGLK